MLVTPFFSIDWFHNYGTKHIAIHFGVRDVQRGRFGKEESHFFLILLCDDQTDQELISGTAIVAASEAKV